MCADRELGLPLAVTLGHMISFVAPCLGGGGGGGGGVVSYPDPNFHSCGWITSPLREKWVW